MEEQLTNILTYHSHKFIKRPVKRKDQVPPQGGLIWPQSLSPVFKKHFHKHIKNLYILEIFHSVHSKFLVALDHIYKVIQAQFKILKQLFLPLQLDQPKRSILSGVGEIVTSIFGGGSLGGYSITTIKRDWENFYILQEDYSLQSWEIQVEFSLINLTRGELGD